MKHCNNKLVHAQLIEDAHSDLKPLDYAGDLTPFTTKENNLELFDCQHVVVNAIMQSFNLLEAGKHLSWKVGTSCGKTMISLALAHLLI